jgi:DoxX-like family
MALSACWRFVRPWNEPPGWAGDYRERDDAMSNTVASAKRSSVMLWTGRVMSAIVVLFLLMDAGMKLADVAPVKEAAQQLGWPLTLDRVLGVIDLACLVLYAVPRTAVLGAILMTGLLGGAIAAHLRLLDPLFTHTLFGVYLGLLAWGGLWLRDARLRALIPLRAKNWA